MKKHLLLLSISCLLFGTAQAQATFSVGPRVGLNVAAAHFPEPYRASHTSRAGFEAGLTSNLQFGRFALQPSLLFSQKGYHSTRPVQYIDPPIPPDPGTVQEAMRLNYLTLPLNLAFSLERGGQGLQVFGGPYVSMLVGGHYTRHTHINDYFAKGVPYDRQESWKVQGGDIVSDSDNEYSQRFDGGLQAGVGYRLGGLLVQAGYSLGLRNLAVQYEGTSGTLYDAPAYYNRAFQVSLSYLVGSKG